MRTGHLLATAALALATTAAAPADQAPPFSFRRLGPDAGLTGLTTFGGKATNRYLLETTGSGAAFFDADGDGWLDAFLVNGTTLAGFPAGKEPTNHLYLNRHDGTFEDASARSGLATSGWGQGVCVGDYDNDGREDVFVTYFGQNRLFEIPSTIRPSAKSLSATIALGVAYPALVPLV